MNEEHLKFFKEMNVQLSMSLPGYLSFEEHTGVDNADYVLAVSYTHLFIEPLLQHDYRELTVPDKPTSPKQQYRTTKKGLLFLETV